MGYYINIGNRAFQSDRDADSAINQIHRKDYPAKVRKHAAHLVLAGISYDRNTKQHSCQIEEIKQ